jgi:DNA (cytosine-5)-methyltransferase 1/DNA adenine methylase
MRYGSVCSGIEAASVAWESLGWQPAWFAEIEAFPSAVLAHHWPDVANLGDMTEIAAAVHSGEVEAPEVVAGGTPCQSYSIGGKRQGLSDPRGQLTLSYVELADAIDSKRRGTAIRKQSSSGKTSPGHSHQKTTPSVTFSQEWLEKLKHSNLVHDLQQDAAANTGAGIKKPVNTFQSGQSVVLLLDDSAEWPGEPLMLNTSDWPSDAREFCLLQALEQISIPQKYYLSPTACAGLIPVKADARACLSYSERAGSLDDRETYIVTPERRIRHLMPIENERQMGFPDNHTLIPWRGKVADDCPDGPRYKAIGNSMAVPVMRWIGERIAAALPVEAPAPRNWQRPFLKWAGGKYSLLPELERLIPAGNVLLSLLWVAARCSLTQTSTSASFWLTSTLT